MGMFDFLKKKEEAKKGNAKEYNLLSANGLVDFVKANLDNPTNENVAKAIKKIAEPDADQEHLTKEGGLPWGWHSLNKDFTDKIHGEYSYFLDRWISSKKASPREQYGALESFVTYMQDTQRLCYSKGECFAYWFDILAEPEYIEQRSNELAELKENWMQLQKAYEKKQKEMIELDNKAFKLLKENEGILQTDFIKMFDASIKNEVSELLYLWIKEGKIERIKSGRSYVLRLK